MAYTNYLKDLFRTSLGVEVTLPYQIIELTIVWAATADRKSDNTKCDFFMDID